MSERRFTKTLQMPCRWFTGGLQFSVKQETQFEESSQKKPLNLFCWFAGNMLTEDSFFGL